MLGDFLWTDLNTNESVGKPWTSAFQNAQIFDETPTPLGLILILVQRKLIFKQVKINDFFVILAVFSQPTLH